MVAPSYGLSASPAVSAAGLITLTTVLADYGKWRKGLCRPVGTAPPPP